MKRNLSKTLCILVLSSFPALSSAGIITMDFEGLVIGSGAGADTTTASYTEDGITMDPLGHYDRYQSHPILSPGTNKNAVIHEGNSGSNVMFTFGGTAFNLLQLDVIGWLFGDAPVVTETSVTIASSSGGSHVLSATATGVNFTGLLDFSTIVGFTNITSFSFSMPNASTVCSGGNNCPNFSFDNVTIESPPGTSSVPEPGALVLLLAGLIGSSLRRFKRV